MAFLQFAGFFFFNDTATTEIYTLSLHDALPICDLQEDKVALFAAVDSAAACLEAARLLRSEEHTSELQSRLHLVCRLLLEKKKKPAKRKRRAALSTSSIRALVDLLLLPRKRREH